MKRLAWLMSVLLLVRLAHADPVEPPPEAGDGADYVIEPADTLDTEAIEVGLGAWARPGGSLRRTRRVRFRGEGFSGSVRDGGEDPLRGGVIESRVPGGALVAGRLAPRWGRGLVLGSPADPWSGRAIDRGRASFRGRAGDGVRWRMDGGTRFEVLAGRFGRRGIAGARWQNDRLQLGAITDARRRAQTSLALAGAGVEAELAADERGQWRAEAAHRKRLGRLVGTGHLRAGAVGFRSIAEPLRSGPPQALTLGVADVQAVGSWHVIVSLWRFAPSLTGARAALRMHRATGAGDVAVGLESQRGIRRLSATRIPLPRSPRQGGWFEWTASRERLTLGLRQELWGESGFARAVRRVSGVRVELSGPYSIRLRVAHTVFRTAFGENLYVQETYSDRLVLRSLTGHGQRTRVAIRLPAAGGTFDASIDLTLARTGLPRAVWTLDWSRSARVSR